MNLRRIKNEETVSQHINVATHYADDALLDKSGKLIKIFKLAGIDFVTQDEQTLAQYKLRRNHLLKNFSSEYAFYFWDVRRKTNLYPLGNFKEGYANDINTKYKKMITEKEMFHTEHYLAVITKQPEGVLNLGFNLWQQLNGRLDKKTKSAYLEKRYRDLHEITQTILNAFSDYQCELLTVYEKNNKKFSAPLEFLSKLINFEAQFFPLSRHDVSSLLSNKRLFFNNRSGTVELRSASVSQIFAAMLSIKNYSATTKEGTLNELNALPCEFVITQSFRFYDKHHAKSRLRDQQKEMLQSKDESISLTDEIDDVFDGAASGDVAFGKHHFTLACYADTQEQLNKHVGILMTKFSDVDITCVREDIAVELGFWAQLPGNFSYIARPADISTKNMAALASFHNYSRGKLTGNHWGDAVTVFETLSGSPYYFNFHYKDVGNFLIFGAMGSGKTVLSGFLIAQSMKFGGKRIIFDKDRGLEILVRAMEGTYSQIQPGKNTGFNPCQLTDTTENRNFLLAFFKKILSTNGETLTENDIELITSVITGLYRLPQASRQFQHIASFFGTKKQGTLRARFDQWHSDGAYAWAFDNADDALDLNADVIGFDIGHILSDTTCKTPVLMYLIHRVEQAIANQRGMLFIDEGWLALSDDYFINLINDWSRTFRKKDNIFGLATQVANDVAGTSLSRAIYESAATKIFFPNPNIDRRVLVEEYGLSIRECDWIRTAPDDQHYFLLVHGRGAHKQSAVVTLNLSALPEIVAVISARESSLALLDDIRKEAGDCPKKFLPLFHARRKQ